MERLRFAEEEYIMDPGVLMLAISGTISIQKDNLVDASGNVAVAYS